MMRFILSDALSQYKAALSQLEFSTFWAKSEIVNKYRRSVLGPFWITLTTAIYILALALVFGTLFGKRSVDLIPWIALGVLLWNFTTEFLNGSTTVLILRSGFLLQGKPNVLPLLVYKLIAGLITLAHNLVVYIPIAYIYHINPGLHIFWLLITFPLFLLCLMWMGVVLGILTARIRDLEPLTNSFLMISFFVTPIMWTPDLLSKHQWILTLNPFQHLISIVRMPLLGLEPSTSSLVFCLCYAVFGWGLVTLLLARFVHRVPYWV